MEKQSFAERMKLLLGKDFEKYWKTLGSHNKKTIRVNTLKITPEELKKKFNEKNWKVSQPFEKYPEIMIIESNLLPGELGRSLEHLLGYYYVQDISSMLPVLVLNPKENENVLDICAAPGSKTSQIAARMNNTGVIIANDISIGRIQILAANLERCGVSNAIITKSDGIRICNNLEGFQIDKILLDAPCSGEGTIADEKEVEKEWNIKKIYSLSKIQKKLFSSAIRLLKPGGEIVYSTCTYAPEENEEVINSVLKENKNIKIEKISLPKEMSCRKGIGEWNGEKYSSDLKNACRIYPQDTNSEGFFIAKFKKAL